MSITFEQAEQQYYEPIDDEEYDICLICEITECSIKNGEHICEDCRDLERIEEEYNNEEN